MLCTVVIGYVQWTKALMLLFFGGECYEAYKIFCLP